MKTLQKQQDILCPHAESRTAAYLLIKFTPWVIKPSLAQGQLGHAAPQVTSQEGNKGAWTQVSYLCAPAPTQTKARAASRGQRNWQKELWFQLKAE